MFDQNLASSAVLPNRSMKNLSRFYDVDCFDGKEQNLLLELEVKIVV